MTRQQCKTQADAVDEAIAWLKRAIELGETTPVGALSKRKQQEQARRIKDCNESLADLQHIRNSLEDASQDLSDAANA